MSNPFESRRRNGECQNCESPIEEGELMYAHDDMFICESCAEEAGCVCACGNYKKPEYDECYTCHNG